MLNQIANAIFSKLDRQKVLYVLVGLFNTGVGISVFFTLYLCLHDLLHYQVITVLSHLLSVFSSWLMYRRYVFKSDASPFIEYLKFNVSSLVMLGFQMLGLFIFVDQFNINPIISQPIVVFVAVIVSYVIHSKFTFSRLFS